MYKLPLFFASIAVPSSALAQSDDLFFVVSQFDRLLDNIIPVLLMLAIAYFFWGLAKFILSAGDMTKQAEGKSVMVWGVLALFVMVSVWGLVAVLQSTFGATNRADTTSINPFGGSNNNGGNNPPPVTAPPPPGGAPFGPR